MKHLFTLILFALLPYIGANAADEVRYITMTDGKVYAIPEKYILAEETVEGVCTLTLEGGKTFDYPAEATVSDSYDVDVTSAQLLSFGFTHEDNDQVYADVEATIEEDGEKVIVTADVPVIGKRLRPSFTVSEGVTLCLDGVEQVSGQSSLRFDAPVTYTLALYWIYEVESEEAEAGFKPLGRPCEVNVKYLTDYATGEYKIPTVYITFGDGVTWDYNQWIGQTLYDEAGNSYNTKEEWIEDCTFRLDGAGVWPDIDTVEGCEVRGRGNTSWSFSPDSKNPYRIKFPKKQKQSPFNLTEDRQWVFIANKQNGSMTTNSIAQKIAAMVDAEAICHMIPIDLYINGHYRGSYCFTEKIGIADNSVAIDEATGCLLELDDYFDEDYKFKDDNYNLPVNVKDPDFGEEDEERVITFGDVQASINNLTYTLASGGDITEYVDMESWAKFWLVNDLVRNVETYHPKSCYLFNENPAEGGLWKFGPAWDFDWAFGYEESYSYFASGAAEDIYSKRSGKAGYDFYNALRNTEAGKRAYYKEWMDFVAEGRIQELKEYIADYTEFALLSIAHNNDANISEKNSTDYQASVKKSQDWIEARANYIINKIKEDTDEVRYITKADGQVYAIPEKYILAEETSEGVCTLTLDGGETFDYPENATVSNHYDVTSAKLLSFGFTHEDNDQVYADVEATIEEAGEKVIVTADVPVIGKRLRPSFTVSEGVTLCLDGVEQVSGQSSLRFDAPVTYTLALPNHWIYEVKKEETEDTTPEPTDGWVRTKMDISWVTTTNAPTNYSDYLSNLWDDDHVTYFHSTWGSGAYDKLYWYEGGYYGDGITEWPYVQIELTETLENFCLSYATSNQNNRFPQGWRITARYKDTDNWDEIDVLTLYDDALPQTNLTEFVTPVYELGEGYTAIRLELTAASYKNYMVIGDLSLYKCEEVIEEPVEPSEPETPEVEAGFKPFGRPCEVNVKYLTDYATGEYKIPTVYITFGDGVTWGETQWIGQTLPDGTNTKEEWIKKCTFRLDGAGVWPDIDTVEGCEVRGRGNSSWSWSYMSKNPYRIKFPKEQKQSPFNLTKDRQWVFIANKQNGSMTTNSIAQKIAAMVDAEAICHMIPIDLYINGHYRGSYCFTEKIGIADNSVAIDEATGCLLELDDYFDEDYKFKDDNYNLPVNVKDPDFGEEDEERVITFGDVQASINNLTYTLASGGDITEYVDMESWAKFWLVNDLVRNVETYHPKSCYLFNENPAEGGLWKFGPAWDFDWAFGYEESYSYFASGAAEDIYSKRSGKAGYDFYNALRNTEAGKRAYYKEWKDFMDEGRLEELKEYIADYTEFALRSIQHNNDADISEKNYTDYEALVEKSQVWIENRANYIFSNLTVYGDSTGIIETPNNEIERPTNGQIYDVYGRRVIEPKKGVIYIINGKKVLF